MNDNLIWLCVCFHGNAKLLIRKSMCVFCCLILDLHVVFSEMLHIGQKN